MLLLLAVLLLSELWRPTDGLGGAAVLGIENSEERKEARRSFVDTAGEAGGGQSLAGWFAEDMACFCGWCVGGGGGLCCWGWGRAFLIFM